jgi:DNA-binding NarL/FixJ family response regulator
MNSSIETNWKPADSPSCRICRVLIVDDHPLYRDGLKELFSKDPGFVVVAEAESEEHAFRSLVESKADLVTVDVSLAAGNGLNLIARIKLHSPATIVLVISMYEDKVYSELALAAGASGYVCKQMAGNEIRRAVDTVLKGGVFVSPGLRGEPGPNWSSSNSSPNERRLSRRELQIFTMIGQGRTTHDIARELRIAVSTVETYRERLKDKLNLSSGSALTRQAIFWLMQER